ncbi:hypothetical protein ASD24_01555 [Paenibacillus sp. Root52]|uniref:hypothetical protein n=1 Tax=Paenibacillus sp. Root52 TaxID=1736552 RepID=UPI0006F86ABD|nr:hypothetical protein [Paenibacillus sp. Root52]KQY94275.1 hypothetical protein ASD24_01555 [Paenibacillus sp. Root52]
MDSKIETITIDNQSKELNELIQELIISYANKTTLQSDEDWIKEELKNYLPEWGQEEVKQTTDELLNAIAVHEGNLKNLDFEMEKGASKEKWFHDKIQEATIGMEVSKVGQYLQNIDSIIANSNKLMLETVHNQNGTINMNSNLDGFIFEQHHANTYNMEAVLRGSKSRAEVLTPKPGTSFGKNSIDLIIRNDSGKIVKKYQAKFSADSDAANRAFDNGHYPFQGKLVAEDQALNVPNAKESIGISDINSRGLSKVKGKELQKLAQEGQSLDVDWNYYRLKDLTSHMTKNVATAGFQAATLSASFEIVYKKMSNQAIKPEDVVEIALRTGTDAGIKSATAVALKVASEKGLISVIPKGTPAGVIATIASIAIENVKVLRKVAEGELSIVQSFEKMERVTVSAVGGLITGGIGASKGAVIGATALSWLPVIGSASGAIIGSIIGGTIAYMAGSTLGEKLCEASKVVRNTAINRIKLGLKAVGEGYKKVGDFIKSLL